MAILVETTKANNTFGSRHQLHSQVFSDDLPEVGQQMMSWCLRGGRESSNPENPKLK